MFFSPGEDKKDLRTTLKIINGDSSILDTNNNNIIHVRMIHFYSYN